jgi:ribonucleoside-triphosphate reductase
VTINLPKIAYQSNSEADFFTRLDRIMDVSARSLSVKRGVVSRLLDEGLYPYTKCYLGTFSNHFSTIGIVGMNEAGLNAKWLRKDMTHSETQRFAARMLDHMRERLADYQEQYGDLYNLEATPAESTTYRFAKHDKESFPDIITAGAEGDDPFYTNSTHLPVESTADIFEALDVQDDLQTRYTSGTVFHAFLGEKLPDWQSAAKLVRTIAENYKLPYYTISPTYSICKNHGYIKGEAYKCPDCGEKAEVYSRITGYYRPVQNWNVGKSQEYKNRLTYNMGASMERYDTAVIYSEGDSELKPVQTTDLASAYAKSTTFGSLSRNSSERTAALAGQPASLTVKSPLYDEGDKVYLFTTSTCPNCKLAKEYLKDTQYNQIDAIGSPDLTSRFAIKQAPTLIVMKDGEITRYTDVSAIRNYAREQTAEAVSA